MRTASGRRYRTGEPKGRLSFTAESAIHRLINTVAPRYEHRPGGYTRLIRLPDRRLGDQAFLAMVQLIGDEEEPTGLAKPRKSARRLRADARYARAVKLAKGWKEKDRGQSGRPAQTQEVHEDREVPESPAEQDQEE